MLEKMKESLDKGVAAVSIKSSEFVETNKLKTQISNYETEIKAKKQELGAVIYKQWLQGVLEIGQAEEICAEIREKEKVIATVQVQIESLLEENKRLLNNNAEGIVCKCGKRNPATAKFCSGCGDKLEQGSLQILLDPSEIQVCPCGAQVKKTAKFCPKCGNKMNLQVQPLQENNSNQQEAPNHIEEFALKHQLIAEDDGWEEIPLCICGSDRKEGAKFCPKCGKRFDA